MKEKSKKFEQHLYHEIEDEIKAEEYLERILPTIGLTIMYFNGLEKLLDSNICQIFSDRSDSIGLIVLHKMNYSIKVDLFKRFCDDLHLAIGEEIEYYQDLIKNLKECGRLRNLVVHADWENTDEDGYTYVSLNISNIGMKQNYVQFTRESLERINELIIKTEDNLDNYWESRNDYFRNN